MSQVRLDQFNGALFDRGRSRATEAAWQVVRALFFDTAVPWPYAIKRWWLRRFGAKIGKRVVLRTRLFIAYPWHLDIGDHCWVGDGCQLLSIARITMEPQSALAHEVYLAAGGHDIRSRTMAPKNEPIHISSGCWIASRAFIGPGVTLGENVVVGAAAVVIKDVEPNVIVGGNPAKVIRERVLDRE